MAPYLYSQTNAWTEGTSDHWSDPVGRAVYADSPNVQVLVGLAGVAAAAFSLLRRRAWLCTLLAALDMTVVFVLNLAFDLPVKQLSDVMTLGGSILLIPNVL